MSPDPLVSIVMPFLNTPPQFLREAVEGVMAQTYRHWELLLVDDGSTGECTAVAKHYANSHPRCIQYLDHEGHENQGISASRNAGVARSKGGYIAFHDADDVWFPHKLEAQVRILEDYPDAAMVYGQMLYWYSWTGNPGDSRRDHLPTRGLGVPPDTVVAPPQLVPVFLRNRGIVPPICSLLVRRRAFASVGGFEDDFRNLYEDQVWDAKICLHLPVYASAECWHWYRQHPDSVCAAVDRKREQASRMKYLQWLDEYVSAHDLRSPEVVEALRKEFWIWKWPNVIGLSPSAFYALRMARKWLLRLEEQLLPASVRYRLWVPSDQG